MAQAIALAFIAPLIALFLAAGFLGETIGPRTIGASLIAFAGVMLIFVGQAQADLGREALLGSFAILASAVCYAVNIILMRQQALVAGPIEIAFFQNLIVAVLLLAAWPVMGGADFPPADQVPFVLLAAVPLDRVAAAAVLGLCPRRGQLSRRDRIYRLPVGDAVRLAGVRRDGVALHAGRRGADRRRLHPRRAHAARSQPGARERCGLA